MEKVTQAHIVNPDFSLMSTTQYMGKHENIMLLAKPKMRAEYMQYK